VYIKRKAENSEKHAGPFSKRKQHHKGSGERGFPVKLKPNVGTSDECVISICNVIHGLLCRLQKLSDLHSEGIYTFSNGEKCFGSMDRCRMVSDRGAFRESRSDLLKFGQEFGQELRVIYRA
jgi:hypothetical protein